MNNSCGGCESRTSSIAAQGNKNQGDSGDLCNHLIADRDRARTRVLSAKHLKAEILDSHRLRDTTDLVLLPSQLCIRK